MVNGVWLFAGVIIQAKQAKTGGLRQAFLRCHSRDLGPMASWLPAILEGGFPLDAFGKFPGIHYDSMF
jgi:hypothetical protein